MMFVTDQIYKNFMNVVFCVSKVKTKEFEEITIPNTFFVLIKQEFHF